MVNTCEYVAPAAIEGLRVSSPEASIPFGQAPDGGLFVVSHVVIVCPMVPLLVQTTARPLALAFMEVGLKRQAVSVGAQLPSSLIVTWGPVGVGVVAGLVRKYTPTPTTTSMTMIITARTIVRLFGFGASAGLAVCSIFST